MLEKFYNVYVKWGCYFESYELDLESWGNDY